MNDLIQEYKRTLKDTKTLLPIRKTKLLRAKQIQDIEEIKRLENEIKTINSWISNLQYVIQWLRTGRQPGTTRGVENRAAYQREIPMEPFLMQHYVGHIIPISDNNDELVENANEKENMINELMSTLNKDEKEILVMAANNISLRKISLLTNKPKSTVENILKRCKEKIADEGWMIV